MIKNILFFTIVLLTLFNTYGQTETTIIDYADFVIYGTDKSDGTLKKNVPHAFKASYKPKSDSIIVQCPSNNDTVLKLVYPLKFDVFRENFQNHMGENHDCIAEYHSLLDVFYWLVSISEEKSTQPLAGHITTNNYIITSEYPNESSTQKERLETIESKIHAVDKVVSNINGAKNYTIAAVKCKLYEYDSLEYGLNQNVTLDELLATPYLISNTRLSITKEMVGGEKFILDASNFIEFNSKSINTLRKEKKDSNIYIIASEQYDLIVKQLSFIEKYNFEYKAATDNLAQSGIYPIEKVAIQIERGFIERIQVTIVRPEQRVIYENLFPIGFTSIPNYKAFKDIKLFPRTQGKLDWKDIDCIFLSDVIQNYDNALDQSTKDYSPGDTVVTITPMNNPFASLYKQKSVYLLDGKTFTDINGFNEKSPNGLVQVELSRRFNINTNRKQVHNSINMGFFGYLNAQVNFSKIENKLKGLPLRNEKIVENKAVISPSYASNLDFMRYENLSIRIEPNILTYDVPHYKLTYYIDFGAKYGHTPLTDSTYTVSNIGLISGVSRELDAHSFTFYPKLTVELFAERRYGIKGSYQVNYTRMFTNNNFKQVVGYSGKGNDLESLSINPASRWSHTVEIFGYFDPTPYSGSGKIFAKACFHFQHTDVNTFYPQLLLGYAFNFFK